MNLKKDFMKYLLITFIGLSICLIVYVLFQYPEPGVADQGDFDRIMSISGLELIKENYQDIKLNRFFNYTIVDYGISKEHILQAVHNKVVCSLAYLIILINFICKLFSQDIFKTTYLAIVYSIIYI